MEYCVRSLQPSHIVLMKAEFQIADMIERLFTS